MANNIQWVVQRNLTNPKDLSAIRDACDAVSIGYTEVEIVPFSRDLPFIAPEKQNIFYGSGTFLQLLLENKALTAGLFFDPVSFSMENFIKEWASHMLNHNASIVTFGELITSEDDPERLLFIRPDADSKAFAGEVIKFGEIGQWWSQLQTMGADTFPEDTKILVSEPYSISMEWRLWIVNRKVIAATQYREHFTLKKVRGCPAEVASFAEDRSREYAPHDVFVMDIGQCGDELYIIECNCMNGAGFYDADIHAIVRGVTDYVSESSNH
jgi:hypothetical protein